MIGGGSQQKWFWTPEKAQEVMASLRSSELSLSAAPIEVAHQEYLALTAQIDDLEKKRQHVAEIGKKAIREYDTARYHLFLHKVAQAGKAYCEFGHHVVSKVSVQLIWNSTAWYIKHICSKCVKEIMTGKRARCEIQEMREIEGVRLRRKEDQWIALPEHFYDYTAGNTSGYIDPDLAQKYGLPIPFKLGEFPPDLDEMFRS